MKKLLAAALLVSFGTTANAQLAFNGANITLGTSFQQNGGRLGNFTSYKGDASVDFSIGTFGLQTDLGVSALTNQSIFGSFVTYDAGLHVSRTFGKVKAGVFITTEYVESRGSLGYIGSTYGIEALVDFGKFDIEASIAGVSGPVSGPGLYLASLAGYYEVFNGFDISLGVQSLIQSGPTLGYRRVGVASRSNSLNSYSFGGRFQFPNAPISISASYGASSGNGSGTVSAAVSYGFGGAIGSTRAFQRRNLNYLDRLLSGID